MAELAKDLVLAVMEDISEMDRMIASGMIIFNPLARRADGFKSLFVIVRGP